MYLGHAEPGVGGILSEIEVLYSVLSERCASVKAVKTTQRTAVAMYPFHTAFMQNLNIHDPNMK